MSISLFNYWKCIYTHTHIYIYTHIYMANEVSGYELLERKALRSMGWKGKIDTIYDLEVMQLLGDTIMKNDSAGK